MARGRRILGRQASGFRLRHGPLLGVALLLGEGPWIRDQDLQQVVDRHRHQHHHRQPQRQALVEGDVNERTSSALWRSVPYNKLFYWSALLQLVDGGPETRAESLGEEPRRDSIDFR